MPITTTYEPIVSEPTVEDFILQLLDRLGIDEEDLDDGELDDMCEFASQWAQTYWVADQPIEVEM